jgi:hypothetical protein
LMSFKNLQRSMLPGRMRHESEKRLDCYSRTLNSHTHTLCQSGGFDKAQTSVDQSINQQL